MTEYSYLATQFTSRTHTPKLKCVRIRVGGAHCVCKLLFRYNCARFANDCVLTRHVMYVTTICCMHRSWCSIRRLGEVDAISAGHLGRLSIHISASSPPTEPAFHFSSHAFYFHFHYHSWLLVPCTTPITVLLPTLQMRFISTCLSMRYVLVSIFYLSSSIIVRDPETDPLFPSMGRK